MNRQTLLLMTLPAALFVIAGIILNRQLRHDTALAVRVRSVQRTVGIETVIAPADASQSRLLRLITGVGEAITRGGMLSASTLADLELRLAAAGLRGRSTLAAFIGAKLLALLGLPLLSWLLVERAGWTASHRIVAIAAAGLAGLLLPDGIVRQLHKRHLKAVERGLPDALDMLVICSEAGLGLEPAVERVGREIASAHPDVAEELLSAAREMRVNADRRVALMNIGARTGLASLRRLGVTLVHQGVSSKIETYEHIVDKLVLEDEEVAYMGDDIVDLPVLSRVGLAAAPADAAPDVRARVHWVSQAPGGCGAARELIELILRAQRAWESVLLEYLGQRV